MTKAAKSFPPCGFCNDTGTHAMMVFSTPDAKTSVCSDCIKIFYKRVKSVESEYEPRINLTFQ